MRDGILNLFDGDLNELKRYNKLLLEKLKDHKFSLYLVPKEINGVIHFLESASKEMRLNSECKNEFTTKCGFIQINTEGWFSFNEVFNPQFFEPICLQIEMNRVCPYCIYDLGYYQNNGTIIHDKISFISFKQNKDMGEEW